MVVIPDDVTDIASEVHDLSQSVDLVITAGDRILTLSYVVACRCRLQISQGGHVLLQSLRRQMYKGIEIAQWT